MNRDMILAHLLMANLRSRPAPGVVFVAYALKFALLIGAAWVASQYGFLPGSIAVILAAIA